MRLPGRPASRLAKVLLALAMLVPLAALAASAASDGLVPIPPLTARVTDLTGTLTPQQKSSLEQTLAEFEQRKGSQIAVLMLPSTKPEAIEQYGIRVAEQWKIGRKGTDDGLILIVAKDDHRVRFEVGRGLEGAIPDISAGRIIREIIAPHFLTGDFYAGINDGVHSAIGLIDGEALPPPPSRQQRGSSRHGGDNNFGALVAIGFILVFVVGGVLVRLFGRVLGSGVVAILVAIAAFFALGLVAALIAGIAGFFFSLVTGSGFGRGIGGFPIGGGGFGGSSGGGFSGGGGDFGGGGASGDW
jgi:uncharacterized protein